LGRFDAAVAYVEHAAFLRGYLMRHRLARTVEDADDLVSETFERAMRAEARYRDDGKPRAWLQQIARNLAIDALRRQRGPEMREIPASAFVPWQEPDDRLDLLAACAQLAPRQRQCIVLRYVAGCSRRETARSMGTTEDSAAKLQARGIQRLRDMMVAS